MSDQAGTERTVVKTYVPAYQKDEWTDHADRIGMSTSEFVRTMVQAGRTHFEHDSELDLEEPDDPDTNPRGQALETRIQEILREQGHCSWEELLSRLTGDIEDRLEGSLERLQENNNVQYNGREGGYTLLEE